MSDFRWMSNMQGTRQHIVVSGWSRYGDVAACDKKGIFLNPAHPVDGLVRCRACAKRADKGQS